MIKQFNRFRAIMQNVLKDPEGSKTEKRPEASPKLSAVLKKNLFRNASKSELSASGLSVSLKLNVFVRRAQQVLHKTFYRHYKKMKMPPALTERHRLDRTS